MRTGFMRVTTIHIQSCPREIRSPWMVEREGGGRVVDLDDEKPVKSW